MNMSDKAVLYSIISTTLLAVRYDIPYFYNIGIGLSLGASLVYWIVLSARFRSFYKEEIHKNE